MEHRARLRKHEVQSVDYRGTSLIRNNPLLGPYSRLMPRALWWGGGSYERGTPVGTDTQTGDEEEEEGDECFSCAQDGYVL